MTSREEGSWDNKLKAKEKVLVQLYLHISEPDARVFPFEVTQKGLSEHLGIRRSHVTIALQELAKDDLVEVCKGHVVGGQRRQNAYCITSKGHDLAESVRTRLLSMEVQFETTEGTRAVKVEQILSAGNVSLASIICQMDKGGPVRDEIMVMTSPEKKLISVFCPTCKKQIEVDNFFIDDEVGFDCPGCARPYRIVPALRTEIPKRTLVSVKDRFATIIAATLFIAVLFLIPFVFRHLSFIVVFFLIGVVGLFLGIFFRMKYKNTPQSRTPIWSVALILAASPILLLFWDMSVTRIDFNDELKLSLIVYAALVAGYAVTELRLPDFRGDYMVASGTVMLLIAASIMFVVEFGDLGVGTAPFLGIAAAILFVLSTFQPLDTDTRILDAGLGTGTFLVLITVIVMLPACGEVIDYVAAGATIVLGLLLIGLRAAREITGSKEISAHLVASLPLPVAVMMLIFGFAMIDAGSELAGVLELVAIGPIAYWGVRSVFNDDWIYRVPMTAYVICFTVLVMTAGIIT